MSTPLYIDEYDYPLTDERIAKYPLPQRDTSKLLLYKNHKISEDVFYNIGNYLPSGSLLVYNNTKVIQARLVFHKETGARIEIFCLEPVSPHDHALALGSTKGCTWKCLVGNLKKWKSNEISRNVDVDGKQCRLMAERLSTNGNTHEILFSWPDVNLSFAEILEDAGELPIPPYLNRPTEEQDKITYQTVYSRIKGSVAAPTAGLHFTENVLEKLRGQHVFTEEITLHVGAGTFQPVKTADANEHTMHTEIIAVPRKAIEHISENLEHIVAVGTTSVRTLESLYYIGVDIPECQPGTTPFVTQFRPYEREDGLPVKQALQNILDYLTETRQDTLHAETQIMIKLGYRFRLVNAMITNFHQPKSTLLLLVSAFVGEDWKRIYDYALEHDFRFLSYGDSSLLFPNLQPVCCQ